MVEVEVIRSEFRLLALRRLLRFWLYIVHHPYSSSTIISSTAEMTKQTLDYSLYLVTGRDLLPSGKVCLNHPHLKIQLTQVQGLL